MTRILGLLLVTACIAGTAAAATDEKTALANFQKIVEAGSKSEPYSIYENTRTSKWTRSRNELRNVAYDVKKTDSLVSPLAGVITFEYLTQSAPGVDTKELAEALGDEDIARGGALLRRTTLRYSFQDDKWILKTVTYRSLLRMPNENSFKDTLGREIQQPLDEFKQDTSFGRLVIGFKPK